MGHGTHPTTPASNGLHRPHGSTARPGHPCWIDPDTAGWTYSSLRVLHLAPDRHHRLDTADSEWIVLPLSGAVRVHCEGLDLDLHGRPDVFTAVSDFAYLPRDTTAYLHSPAGGRFALVGARCERRLPPRYGPAHGVPVELRGAGHTSRQVNNFAAAHTFETDRLIAVEVLTPGGNWSSYPPHKHDQHRPGAESQLEEIYYFELRDPPGSGPGTGYHRVTPSGPHSHSDVLAEVRTGDIVLVPDGWHGPSAAPPGHDMYYLNVMAGPERAWLIRDHPDHTWIRDTWHTEPTDPRLPLYTAPTEGPPR
ncbi:5-deoxyglucuronate isomerase [Streptomyces sp. TLI_235]|nr:5-deoxy-glucuronate isomerase [Streptomyces sp. TLI_235]PBC69608.1 5-deoxyglucuronate isomerase [Streptomyces sp. TLI_235]